MMFLSSSCEGWQRRDQQEGAAGSRDAFKKTRSCAAEVLSSHDAPHSAQPQVACLVGLLFETLRGSKRRSWKGFSTRRTATRMGRSSMKSSAPGSVTRPASPSRPTELDFYFGPSNRLEPFLCEIDDDVNIVNYFSVNCYLILYFASAASESSIF